MAGKDANVCKHKVNLDQFNCEACKAEADEAKRGGAAVAATEEKLPEITRRAAIELLEKMPLNPEGRAAVKLLLDEAREAKVLEEHQEDEIVRSFAGRMKLRVEEWGKTHGLGVDGLLEKIDELVKSSTFHD